MTVDDLPRPMQRVAARAAIALGELLARWADRTRDYEGAKKIRATAARIKKNYLTEQPEQP